MRAETVAATAAAAAGGLSKKISLHHHIVGGDLINVHQHVFNIELILLLPSYEKSGMIIASSLISRRKTASERDICPVMKKTYRYVTHLNDKILTINLQNGSH